MFFSLNLIESYGSGIRRAKDALIKNGSPNLKFYPDNEKDNYTNAVMSINAEFLKEFNGSTAQETTQKMKTENYIEDIIINMMIINPNISAREKEKVLKNMVNG
ncbi:putative DNA binding domain-containing protein [Oceanivirga miroungae]|uniref:ATP-dependent DNA helicase RecG C-terminal domain-containing protein n=1 Tax=Oceanivirga miroungae TaxID=1130046 RepID=A0A6I8MF18_9FUSO|nr:hypothetical protein [Oceanivirga miroungae]VWL85862.1 hypothetical protein OMES3154_01148 [Oceanivirga miroungae]